MKVLIGLLCLAAGANAQSLIEDFRCRSVLSVSTGTATTLTCDQPHNFGGRHAISRLAGFASLTDGKTAAIDGVTYTFRTEVNNLSPREVRIGANGAESARNLFNAINDTGEGEGTAYSDTTETHPTCRAYKPSGATVYLRYIAAGTAGHGVAVSAQTPLAWTPSTLQIQWFVIVTGATGQWAGLGSDATPKFYTATYASENSFTVPFNSSSLSAGSFAGQVVWVRRASGDGGKMFYAVPDVQGDVKDSVSDEGTLTVTVPACADSSNEGACSRGYWSPDNQKAYMVDKKIQSFVVSSGVATITLAGAFADNTAGGYEPIAVGQLIHIRGMQQYATSMNPGYDGNPNAPAQPEAANMAKNSTRGYTIQTLSGDKTTLTINTGLADGVYAPSCLPAGACIGRTQAEGFIAITWRASPYIYIRPRDSSGYLFPSGYMQYHTKNGEFDPLSNRMRMWIKWGVNNPRSESGGLDFNVGTYVQTTTQDALGSGAHFYHLYNFSAYDGVWQKLEVNGAPTHQVGASGGILWPKEPLRGQIFYPPYPGGPRSYMDGMTILYLDPVAYKGPWDGQTMHLANLTFDRVDDEPEDLVRGRSIVYSPKRFFGGVLTDDPGYDVSWEGVPISGLTYEVRYSTTQSLKSLGFSSGLGSTIVTPPGVSLGVNGAWWLSPTMSEEPNFWAAVRPRVPAASVSGNGQSPIWVVTRADIGVAAGDSVTVEGVGGNTAANQTNSIVAAVSPRKFWWRFEPQAANGWSVPSKLVSITASGGGCTALLTEAHNLVPGWTIEVQGSVSPVLGSIPTTTPKLYRVTSVPSNESFTFNCAGVPDAVYDTDYSVSVHLAIQAFPGVALSGTGDGDWTNGGIIYSTDEHKNFAEIHYAPFVTNGVPPQPPSSLAASAASSSSINLQWTDTSGGVASVHIERKTGAGGTYSEIALVEPGVSTFTVSGLATGTTYFFRVRASNSSGMSAYGEEASATTIDPTAPPPAPSLLTAFDSLNDHVILRWHDNAANETGFEVQMDSGGGFAAIAMLPANTVEYSTLTGTTLQPSHNYTFRVRAVNGFGSSAFSNTLNAVTLAELTARIGGRPAPDAVVMNLQAPTIDPCQFRAGGILNDETDTGGVRSRANVVGGLTAETSYSMVVKCGSIAARRFEFATAAAAPGGGTFQVTAVRPAQALGANNFVVDYGAQPDNLPLNTAVACTGGSCTATIDYNSGWIVWVSRRWCANRTEDPSCSLPANVLARSKPEPFVLGQP